MLAAIFCSAAISVMFFLRLAMYTSALDNISIVLVDARTPANIGAVARAMMNMGLSRLVLVNAPDDPQHQAGKLAAGAGRILETARNYSSLREAVGNQGLVIGASRHTGRLRKNVLTPREVAERAVPLLGRNRVSLVFGNEVNGLDREDLAVCHEFVSIPSSDAFPSLNLSHAVMVVAYELFIASKKPGPPVDLELANKEELEKFFIQLQKVLEDIGFLDRNQPDRMMFTLRQIFGRAKLDSRDVSILRGISTQVNRLLLKDYQKKH